MPTIVKLRYAQAILSAISENPTLGDADLAATLSAPSKAGETVAAISADAARGQVGWLESAQIEAQVLAETPKSQTAQLAASAWLGRTSTFDFGTGTDDRNLLDTLVNEGLLSPATRSSILTAATVDVPGPSIAEGWGLGECLPCFVEQCREYVGLTEQDVREQLAALLLAQWLRPYYRTVADAAEVQALPEYATFRADVVLPYTELADAAEADAVMAEVLTMLKEADA